MVFPTYQKGLGFPGWFMVMLVVGAVTSVGLKLWTPFSEFYTMESVLEKMAEEDGLANRAIPILTTMIRQRFKINNVRGFDMRKNVKISRTDNGTRVVLDYEVRDNLWRNIDIVTSFKKTVELRR